MKHFMAVVTLLTVSLIFTVQGAETAPTPPDKDQPAVKFSVKGHEFEGCECNSVCPCVFSKDTTFGDCRAILAFKITDGTYGTTNLKDMTFAVILTSAGKNMEESMGKWKGVLYTPDKATPTEREAVDSIVHEMLGDAFDTLEKRTAPIKITQQNDVHELTVGKDAHLRIHGLKNQAGEVTRIMNAPSPIAFPEYYCAKSDVNKFDDGKSTWSFTDRNGFYADFKLSNEN